MSTVSVKITAEASGLQAGVHASEASLEALARAVAESNATMRSGFMQSTLALREIARASGETAEAVGKIGGRSAPSAGKTVSALGQIGLAFQGVKSMAETAGAVIRFALSPSAEMEQLRVSFAVMLGGMGEAKQRMEELTTFADTTPFELPEVAKASKVLQTLTKGALATGDGLRLVGDVAAATGQPFDELATWIGRLYDGLQSGRPVGEALARLQELGVVSGDVRGQIEQLQAEGKKGPEVWGAAQQALGQYGGMMEAQSQTALGKYSTAQDALTSVVREFGDQVLPDASGAMGDATSAMEDLKPAAAALGWVVGSTVKVFRVAFLGLQAFFSGLIPLIMAELGRLLSWSLTTMIGWAEKINGLFGRILPDSWQQGIGSMLSSAKSWTQDLGAVMSATADESVGYLDQIAEKMADVYRPGEIAVPSGGGGAGGGGSGGRGGGGKGGAGGQTASVDWLTASGAADEHNKLSATALADQKAREAAILAQEDAARKESEQKEKEREAKDREKAQAWVARWRSVAASVAGAFGSLANQMTQLWLRGDLTLKKLSQAFKSMVIGMIADLVAFVVKVIAQAMLLKAADVFTGGMVSAVVGAVSASGSGGLGLSLPSFDVGTPRVPRDMVAQIHKDEMIVPATMAEGVRSGAVTLGGSGGGHSASLVLGSDILTAIASEGSALVKIVRNADRMAFS